MAERPSSPVIGSILLASADPAALRAWYEQAFGVTADVDGFLPLGDVGLLIDGRDDVAARAAAARLDEIGVTWLAALEYRPQGGAWFATLVDPDGNYVQIIEITDAYWPARQEREQAQAQA